MALTKRSRATVVKREAVAQASSLLSGLPEKPKDELPLRQAVEQMSESITEALAKGYDYPEVAEMLTNQGIKISATTLRSYVPSKRKATRSKSTRSKKGGEEATPRRRSRSTKQTPPENQEAPSVEAVSSSNSPMSSPEASQPVKSRRGRSKSVASSNASPSSTVTATPESGGEPAKPRRGRKSSSTESNSAKLTTRRTRQAAKDIPKTRTTRRRKSTPTE